MIDLAALQTRDERVHSVVDWANDAAFSDGPLSGLTVGVKSNIMVRGLPWTAGMAAHRDRVAERDAAAVGKLRSAGAAIIGSLNMHEAALGATTANPFYGTTHNPVRHGYTPGGSSGGSGAAVAAGVCDIALGTDTMGSVRIPASYCGVFGLKPSASGINSDGLAFLEPSLDSIGPMARDLETLARAWDVLAEDKGGGGAITRLITFTDLAGVDVESDVRAAFDRTIVAAPFPVEAVPLPFQTGALRRAGLLLSGAYLKAEVGPHWRDPSAGLSADLIGILEWCEGKTADTALLAEAKAWLTDMLDRGTALLLPTAPQAAFPHGQPAPANQADFTCLANIAGLPALSFPAGNSADGLPIGMQIIGPMGSESRLITLARHFI